MGDDSHTLSAGERRIPEPSEPDMAAIGAAAAAAYGIDITGPPLDLD